MKPITTDEEKQQELVIMKRRQGSLLWLGLCLLLLWVLPHPGPDGTYVFIRGNDRVSGMFFEISRLRWMIGFVGWVSVADYLVKPFYVRWRWRKWFPLGM